MTNRNRSVAIWVGTLVVTLVLAKSGIAAPIIEHVGNSDPLTENFGYWPYNGGISTAALPDDNGEQAWQIENVSGGPNQAAYIQLGGTGPYLGGSGLTQAQIDDINAHGFVMSLRARVIEGPVYDEAGSQLGSAAIAVAGFSGFRFEITLGTDGLGNTVVVLPELIVQTGGTFHYDPFGSPYIVPGNDYHLYQIVYDPGPAEAELFIDGVSVATGYPGSAVTGGVVDNNFGLGFGSVNLATANYAMAKLESREPVAVPAFGILSLVLLAATLITVGFLFMTGRGGARA